MTIKQAYDYAVNNLSHIYNQKEAANIADLVIEKITALSKIDRVLLKQNLLTEHQEKQLFNFIDQLQQHKPIQYILNEVWFAGINLNVNEYVLIPRPETEELVEWLINDFQLTTQQSPVTILDIGTGSGCIAIALKKKLEKTKVTALDISEPALQTASANAILNNVNIEFIKADITQPTETHHLPDFDIIVSNPPYVTKKEAEIMNQNVFIYEPHLALFVPDEDPLLFYKSISNFALIHLKKGGLLYVEINESFANEVAGLLHQKKFISIEIRKDLQGKNRMIKAVL